MDGPTHLNARGPQWRKGDERPGFYKEVRNYTTLRKSLNCFCYCIWEIIRTYSTFAILLQSANVLFEPMDNNGAIKQLIIMQLRWNSKYSVNG